MLHLLSDYESFWGPLRVFKYLSFRCLMAWVTALLIGFWVAPWVLRRLRVLNVAQAFRDESEVGRLAHLHAAKKNTPTMGGAIIYISIVLTTLLWAQWDVIYVWAALLVYTVLTALGFIDDYMKVRYKKSKTFKSSWKWLTHGVLSFIVLGLLLYNTESSEEIVQLWVPFVKEPVIQDMAPWFLFLFFFCVITGSSNAINLTDGVDGLAIGCTVIAAFTYSILAYAAGNIVMSNYLLISYVPDVGELAVVCMALVGAGLVFLWYNAHPAEVFMGDTGSLGLGGLIGSIAFMVHQPFTLVIVGGIFVMEAMSVILQVGYFKATGGKRIFRMSPIHHHFELKGWHENKVVIRFWILSVMFAILGLATLKLR